MAISRTGKLNQKLVFLVKEKTGDGPNGTDKYEFVPKFSVWAMIKQKTINQIANESGTILEDTQTIVVRQKQREEPQLDWRILIKGEQYDIVNINPDVEMDGFMVLSVRKVK